MSQMNNTITEVNRLEEIRSRLGKAESVIWKQAYKKKVLSRTAKKKKKNHL